MIRIEITDLGATERMEVIRLAKFLLEYTGFEAPVPQPAATQYTPAPPIPTAPVANPFAAQDTNSVTDATVKPKPVVIPPPPAPERKTLAEHYALPPLTAGIDVDSAGLPWDARIHAATKAKVADGTWRKRRGLADAIDASVTAELKQTMAVPPPPFAVNAAPSVSPVMANILPVASVGAAPTASPSDGATFPKLMQKVTGAFSAGQITQAQILAAVQSVGLPSLPMLASRPDLIGAVGTALGLAL